MLLRGPYFQALQIALCYMVWNGIPLSSPVSWHQIVILPFFRQKTPLAFFSLAFFRLDIYATAKCNNVGNPTKYYTIHQHNIIPRTECHCLICIFAIQNQLVRPMLLIAHTRTSDIALQHIINSSWWTMCNNKMHTVQTYNVACISSITHRPNSYGTKL